MRLELCSIPDVRPDWEEKHKIRVLLIDGKSPVVAALLEWKNNNLDEYKKILKVMERVARLYRVRDEKHVKADKQKRGIYEIRAHRGHARLLFFYDTDKGETVICLLSYWKGRGNQSNVFDSAVRLRELWESSKEFPK